MSFSRFRASQRNLPYLQGRWDTDLIPAALNKARASGCATDWINYLDICHSLQGISLPEWQIVADHYLVLKLRSPKLFFRLVNFALTPGLLQNLIQEDRLKCQSLIQNLPTAHFNAGLHDCLYSGYLGTQVSHYPRLLNSTKAPWSPTLYFSHQRKSHAERAYKLESLETPFSCLISQTLAEGSRQDSTSHLPNIAVVGNSPIILKKNQGDEIDEADIVIRFNHISQPHLTQQQTGKRTDLWVMSPATPIENCPQDAKGVIVTGLHALRRPSFYWKTLPLAGRLLSELPDTNWHELVRCFQAPPSAGTLLLASLSSLPMEMNIRCYGFTTNTLDLSNLPNHHADDKPRSTRHNWHTEACWLSNHFPEISQPNSF
ncbi:MAG: glycosyltransferase family 29 protein [Granulosicoccus sp.]